MIGPIVLVVMVVTASVIIALAIVFIRRSRPLRARLIDDGYQELEIVVKDGFLPNVIEVERGIPVRLCFRREEDTSCSERVIFSDFHVGSRLPANTTTPVCFIPTKCGEFLFTCAMGMYQGRLIVVETGKRNFAGLNKE